MLVYHFITREFGLEDIRRRRLKIATIADLNDPFELLGPASDDPAVQQRLYSWRAQFNLRFGMLCFSRGWRNPVQWSHYAEKHRGLCLGFEISNKHLAPVRYRSNRLSVELALIDGADLRAHRAMLSILTTKYVHWRYEREMRLFTVLENRDQTSGLFFADFSRKMRLREVIVGPLSTVTSDELNRALGALRRKVVVYKAHLALRTYAVARRRC